MSSYFALERQSPAITSIAKGATIKTLSNLGIIVSSNILPNPKRIRGATSNIIAIIRGWSKAKLRNQLSMAFVIISTIVRISFWMSREK